MVVYAGSILQAGLGFVCLPVDLGVARTGGCTYHGCPYSISFKFDISNHLACMAFQRRIVT
jgi:hypothetical protein